MQRFGMAVDDHLRAHIAIRLEQSGIHIRVRLQNGRPEPCTAWRGPISPPITSPAALSASILRLERATVTPRAANSGKRVTRVALPHPKGLPGHSKVPMCFALEKIQVWNGGDQKQPDHVALPIGLTLTGHTGCAMAEHGPVQKTDLSRIQTLAHKPGASCQVMQAR